MAAAGAAELGVLSQTAKSYAAAKGANDKIRLGAVGCGGQGRSLIGTFADSAADWNCEVTAVCDVYDKRKDQAKERAGGNATIYHHYGDLLAHDGLDGVIIATPDHWHAKICLDALEKGLHVYCEKPFTHTPHEALAVHKKVQQTSLKLQVGSQHTSDGAYYAAKKAIEEGVIGKPLWSETGYSRNNPNGEWNWTIDEDAKPGVNLDWDLWLGYAPKISWDPDRFFRFRKYYDYSGGIATDLFYHKLAPFMIAFGDEMPLRACAGGGKFIFKDDREVPDTSFNVIDYPSGHSIILHSSMCNSKGTPDRIHGQKANMDLIDEGRIRITAEEKFADEFKDAHDGKTEIILEGKPNGDNHRQNFLEAIRGNQELNLDSKRGYATQVAISLGVYALRQGKTVAWDEYKGVVTAGPDDTHGAVAGVFPPAYLKKSDWQTVPGSDADRSGSEPIRSS
jgi:predicted dehydrogenase